MSGNLVPKSQNGNMPERFAAFKRLLAEYESHFLHAIAKGRQNDDVPALMLKHALQFGQRTIESIEILMNRAVDTIFPCALSRAYYELAIRLLWASREPHGWEQLQTYFCNEDKKWSQEAVEMPEITSHAQQVLQSAKEVLGRQYANGETYKVAPGLEQMLREIEDRDISQGIRQKGRRAAAYEYTNVYRIVCRPAHAHIQAISAPAGSFFSPTVFAIGLATFSLLRAVCYVGAKDPGKEIKAIELEMVDTLKQLVERGEEGEKS